MIWGYHHFKKSIVYDEMWNGINSEAVSWTEHEREKQLMMAHPNLVGQCWWNFEQIGSFWYSSDYQLPYFFWMLLMCRHLRTSDTPGFRLFFCHCCASDCSRTGSWKWNAAPKPQLFFPLASCHLWCGEPGTCGARSQNFRVERRVGSLTGWQPGRQLVTFPGLRMVREQPVFENRFQWILSSAESRIHGYLLGSTLNCWAPAAPAPPVTRFVKVSNPNSKLEDSTSKSCWEVGNLSHRWHLFCWIFRPCVSGTSASTRTWTCGRSQLGIFQSKSMTKHVHGSRFM